MSKNTGANDNKESIFEVFSRVSRQAPPFCPEEPDLWFSQLEAEFASSGITADSTKYYYVLTQLEHQYALEVKDVIATPPHHSKYLQLKRELISRLTALQEKKALQLPKDKELSLEGSPPSVDDECLQTACSGRSYTFIHSYSETSAATYSVKQEFGVEGPSDIQAWVGTETSVQANPYQEHAVMQGLELKQELDKEEEEEKGGEEEWGCGAGGMKQDLSMDGPNGDSSEHETEASTLADINRHCVKIEPGCVDKEETEEEEEEEWWCGISDSAALAGLYAGHVVKRELVLGPELLQAPSVAAHPGTSAEPSTASQDAEEASGECHVEGIYSLKLQHHPIDEHRHTRKEQPCGSASMAERQSITEVTKNKVTFGQVNTADKPYKCHVCNKLFGCNKYLKAHFRIQHKRSKAYACDICSKEFSQSADLVTHKRTHTGEKPYACDICNRRFTQSSHLNKHKRIHTGEKPYACDICNKRFAVSSGLVKHKLYHTGEKPYMCEICNKQFTHGYYLKDHKLIHAAKKLYTCEICKRQYAQLRNLVSHKRIHTEKNLSCDICNKQFTRRYGLITHKRIHTAEKLHTCDICNKRFVQYGGLVKHKLIHTGEKPYMCEICNKQFTHQYMLNQHKRVHTDDNPSCDICNKQFSRLNDLIRHKRIHTGEKPYPCDICNKRFIQKSGMKEHRRRIHTRAVCR